LSNQHIKGTNWMLDPDLIR